MFLCCLNAQHRVVGHRCTKETPCSCWKPFQIRTCCARIGIECWFALHTWKVTVGPSPNQSQAFSRQESFADGTGHLPSPFLFPICFRLPFPVVIARVVPQTCSSDLFLRFIFLVLLVLLYPCFSCCSCCFWWAADSPPPRGLSFLLMGRWGYVGVMLGWGGGGWGGVGAV